MKKIQSGYDVSRPRFLNASHSFPKLLSFFENDVSEIGSVDITRCERGTIPTQLDPSERTGVNQWTHQLMKETDAAIETLYLKY
jgi:hypothetical protein